MNPRDIAALLTEDPDVFNEVLNEEIGGWTAEEIAIPPQLIPPQLRGAEYSIDFVFEWSIQAGEPRVMYDRNHSGYPGSDVSGEVTKVEVKEVASELGPVPLTPQLNAWCKEWFLQNEDEIIQRQLEQHQEPEPDWDSMPGGHDYY